VKVENHAAAVAIYTLRYNFARQHKSLSNPYPRTSCNGSGHRGSRLDLEEIAALGKPICKSN
jgi:hypothetical protein